MNEKKIDDKLIEKDEKSITSKLTDLETELEIDDELIDKIKSMNNDEIGEMLKDYIMNHNTKNIIKIIEHCNYLQLQSIQNNDNKTNESQITSLDLNYILNTKKYGKTDAPLVLMSVWKNNLDVTKLLIKYGVCYTMYNLCLIHVNLQLL